MDVQFLAIVLTLLVMLVGLAGVVVPILPDVWLIWLAALGYGLWIGFDGWIGGLAMAALTVLTVIGIAVDLFVSHASAVKGGASWQAIAASVALGLAGLFVFPPIGPLAGAVLGLFLVEYFQHDRDARRAWRSVWSYAAGLGLSAVLRLAICVGMIGVWAGWVLLARLSG